MICILIILFFVSRVNLEMQSMQHHMYMSRKSRSNTEPYESGYVYNQVNNHPGTFATFGNGASGYKSHPIEPNLGKYSSDSLSKYGETAMGEYGDSSLGKYSSPNMNEYSSSTGDKYGSPMEPQSDPYMNTHSDSSISGYSDSFISKYSASPITEYSDSSMTKYSDSPITKYSDYSAPNSAHMSSYTGLGFTGPIIPYTEAPPSKHSIDYAIAKSEVNYDLAKMKANTHPGAYTSTYTGDANTETVIPYTGLSIPEHSIDYEIAKSEAMYDSKYIPAKIKADARYERLKSLMHYTPPADISNEMIMGFDNEFHIDDDDVRTNSRNSYGVWPYFYHSPYEYEHMKIDSEIEKAKDKRYAVDTGKSVIPVYENNNEILHNYNSLTTPIYHTSTTDNPVSADKPFFSFVLNDYFDRNNEEDPLVFKGLDWGKDFDQETNYHDYTYADPKRHLTNHNHGTDINHDSFNSNSGKKYDSSNVAQGESVTEKGYDKKHEFDEHEKGDDGKENHKAAYEHGGQNYRGFKNFLDTFANKFGSEDQKKDSKYALKKSQDKAEKKKGFRRVYHKDEYQEDNEYFDNTHNSAKAEEKGSSSGHLGGSEGYLQSNAAAALGNEANAFVKGGNTENKKFENNHSGHGARKGLNSEFNRYRDVAKKAAQSNNADYTDHYRI